MTRRRSAMRPMRRGARHRVLVAALLATAGVTARPAAAQSAPAANSAERSYATVLRLIQLMVVDGLISQAQAKKLIAEADAGPAAIPLTVPRTVSAGDDSAAPTVVQVQSQPLPDAPGGANSPYLQNGIAGRSVSNPNMNTTEATVDDLTSRIAAGKVSPSPSGLKVVWGPGAPLFSSADGFFTLKVRGRIALDFQQGAGSSSDRRNLSTTGSRGLRLGVEGTIGGHFVYQFENDYSENKLNIQGAFVGWKNKLFGNDYDIRFGNATYDRGLEFSYAFDSQAFADRSTVSTSLLPNGSYFGVGIHARLFGNGWHIGTSFTGDTLDGAKAYSDSRVWTIRAHVNPIRTKTDIVHFGGWFQDEHFSGAPLSRTQQVTIGGRFNDNLNVTTGPVPPETGANAFGAEFLYAHRNLYAWSEYGQRRVDVSQPATGDFLETAWAASAGWFVTGETAPYSARNGNFEYPHVRRSVFDGGPGAISLVTRYESVDYSRAPSGGTGHAYTLGANWYLTDNVRLLANLIRWHTDNKVGLVIGPDDGETLILRGAVIF